MGLWSRFPPIFLHPQSLIAAATFSFSPRTGAFLFPRLTRNEQNNEAKASAQENRRFLSFLPDNRWGRNKRELRGCFIFILLGYRTRRMFTFLKTPNAYIRTNRARGKLSSWTENRKEVYFFTLRTQNTKLDGLKLRTHISTEQTDSEREPSGGYFLTLLSHSNNNNQIYCNLSHLARASGCKFVGSDPASSGHMVDGTNEYMYVYAM